MNSHESRNIFIAGGFLALTALIGTGLMVGVNSHAKPYIEKNEHEVLVRTINSVLPAKLYDNRIIEDTIYIESPELLGTKDKSLIYRAKKGKNPTAAVLTVIAPDGYTGPITLLVAVDHKGKITGVRVVKHRETPGLGDAIESQRSNWIRHFAGKSITNPGSSGWKVKRDGGEFDQFTGATITPRAVVGAVHKALIFFEQNRERIFYLDDT